MRRQFAILVFVFGVFFVEALPCAAAVLMVSPGSLDFTIPEGGENPSVQVLRVSNAEAGSLSWTIEEDCAWLSLNRYSGTIESGFTSLVVVTVDAAGLGAGNYTCDMVVRSDGAAGSPQVVRVTLDVVGPTLGRCRRCSWIIRHWKGAPILRARFSASATPKWGRFRGRLRKILRGCL